MSELADVNIQPSVGMSYVVVAAELMCSVYIVLCMCLHVHSESKTAPPTSCHSVSNTDSSICGVLISLSMATEAVGG